MRAINPPLMPGSVLPCGAVITPQYGGCSIHKGGSCDCTASLLLEGTPKDPDVEKEVAEAKHLDELHAKLGFLEAEFSGVESWGDEEGVYYIEIDSGYGDRQRIEFTREQMEKHTITELVAISEGEVL